MHDIEKAYEVLGLKPNASIEELKLSYRDLVNVWHPDRFQHNSRLKEKAKQQLQEINRAYELLLPFLESNSKGGQDTITGDTEKHGFNPSNFEFRRKLSKSYSLIPVWLIRFLARTVDCILFALMFGYTGFNRIFHLNLIGRILFVVVVTLLWAFVEANLLSSLGSTPGKWLLGIRVITRNGKKPSLLNAFRRSMQVWIYGLGAGIVPVMLMTMLFCCKRLMNHHPMYWDISGQFLVICNPRGYSATIVAFLIVLMGCWVLIL